MSVALVTGASRGIGQEISRFLAGRGWDLGLIATNRGRLEEVGEALRQQHGVRVCTYPANVSDWSQLQAATTDLTEQLGPVDLLVNNAGRVDAEVPLWEADPEEWVDVIEVNLVGPFYLERLLVPSMLKRGGGIVVNLVSGAGARDWGTFTAYTASKTALIRNVGDLHVAGYSAGLRAFGIAPGVVDTEMARSLQMHADRTEFTPVERTLALLGAILDGQLDPWAGTYLRASDDTVESLRQFGPARAADPLARTLGIIPVGPDDPLR